MDPTRALEVAIAEGLVIHRTSLVLVDEAGEIQEGLPRTVKIPLATPRTGVAFEPVFAQPAFADPVTDRLVRDVHRIVGSTEIPVVLPDIDWRRQAPRLLRGDLSGLDPELADLFRALAEEEDVVRLARRLGLEPILLVLYLIARTTDRDRFARRFAHKLVRSTAPAEEAELRRLQEELFASMP